MLNYIHNLIRGGVHRRLRESNSLSNLSAASIRIESNSNHLLGDGDATGDTKVMDNEIETNTEQEAYNEGKDFAENWYAFKLFQQITLACRALTSTPWMARPNLDPSQGWYLSGPPETRIVAEGLTKDDAQSLAFLINKLPEAAEAFEDLAKLWTLFEDGAIKYEEISSYLEIVGRYQTRLAVATGDPKVIPEVETAGELSFLHIGTQVSLPEGYYDDDITPPIINVKDLGEVVSLTVGYDVENRIILPKDTKVTVHNYGSVTRYLPSTESSPVPISS